MERSGMLINVWRVRRDHPDLSGRRKTNSLNPESGSCRISQNKPRSLPLTRLLAVSFLFQ